VCAEVVVLVSGYHHEVDPGFEVKFKLPGLGFTFGKRGGFGECNLVDRLGL
jgi:hypothetical protein